jgi:hemerythrin-like domain-containing protein
MQTVSLATALEDEHREIDAAIEAFTAAPSDPKPLIGAIEALRCHIYLEEEFLFPLLDTVEPGLAGPLAHMLCEHAQIWITLDDLESALETGSDAAPELCGELTAQLLHHNLKEEKFLYPLADAAPLAAVDRMRALLDAATPPEGWVCRMGSSGPVSSSRPGSGEEL